MLLSTAIEDLTNTQIDQIVERLERTGKHEDQEHAAELRRFKLLTKRQKRIVAKQLQ